MTRHCPKCGQEPSKTKPFIEGFCASCYFERQPLIVLRHPPQAKICPRCQAYYHRGKWIRQGEKIQTDHLYSMVCDLLDPLFSPSQPAAFEVQLIEPQPGDSAKVKAVQVEITAKADEYPHEERQVLTIPVTPTLCNQCKQTAGGYFEATLQIRSFSGKLDRDKSDQIVAYLNQRLIENDTPTSSLKFRETRGGFDAKCTSGRLCRSLAKNLAEQFGLIATISSKVAGRARDGKTLRRDTYLLRFPPYQVQDVIAYKQQPFVITGLRKGRYTLTNPLSEQRETLSPKDLSEIDGELLNDEVETYQVISKEGEVYQLMSQADYSLFDIPLPTHELQIGSMVRAIEWKNQLVLLPEIEE
jgi:NMD protein affecting ribosome stability and mRNA decay